MESQRQAALSLINSGEAERWELLPLSYDGQVLRVAATDPAVHLGDLCLFLGVARIDVEVWSGEQFAAGLAESYPAQPLPPLIPVPRLSAAHRVFEFALCVGSVAVCQMVGVMVRGRRPLAAVEGYRCPCGHRMEVGFHPDGRIFTVHCTGSCLTFAHFECKRPPAWWRERVHFEWMDG